VDGWLAAGEALAASAIAWTEFLNGPLTPLEVIAIERPSRRVLHLPDVWKGWNPTCTRGNHELLIALKEEDSTPLYLSRTRISVVAPGTAWVLKISGRSEGFTLRRNRWPV
jgi:hypothetical protein